MSEHEEVLPPWYLEAETFMFFGWSWSPQLPSGSFHPEEEQAILGSENSFLARTPYVINIFRYKKSPVGPYDEIMFIPGFFKTAVKDKKGQTIIDHSPRISRIYVSSDISIYNGRRNWNIPKHKASFDFDYQSNGDIKINISLPGSSEPFFSAVVTPSKRLPAFRLSTDWIPISLDLVQPPLPSVDSTAVASDWTWLKTPFEIDQPRAQVAYIKPALQQGKSYANGVNFPNIAPFSTGLYCRDAQIDFMSPVPLQVVAMPEAAKPKKAKVD